MEYIRKAISEDLTRIAEIEVFNYRLNFYPVFQNDRYYFGYLQVPTLINRYAPLLDHLYVYDDGVVKGFILVDHGEVKKLYVEPVLQGQSIGAQLLKFAICEENASRLWALEKNKRAIAFYARHGFQPTGEKKFEDGTSEYLLLLSR